MRGRFIITLFTDEEKRKLAKITQQIRAESGLKLSGFTRGIQLTVIYGCVYIQTFRAVILKKCG